MQVDMKIWMALRSVLLAEVSLIAKVEGVSHHGQSPGTFITAAHLTAPPQRTLLKAGQRHIRTGSLVLNYISPIGEVNEVYFAKALEIAACFPEGRKINYQGVCVEITNDPHVQDGYRDGGDWRVPITVTWRTFA